MSKKYVLAILGSPHSDGTVGTMLNHAASEAKKAGYEVIKINLYEKNIAFCQGCRVCLKTETCVQKDDIQEMVSLFRKCQVVILGAPVYWANVPAPVKNLFDRLLGTVMEETATFPKPRMRGKKYMLLTACQTPAPFSWIFGQSRGAIRNMEEFFKIAGMRSMGKIVCADTRRRNEIPDYIFRKIGRCWKKSSYDPWYLDK